MSADDSPAIATRSLSKRYREVLAVDSLDLDVRRGEIYGFLGHNADRRRGQAGRRAADG
jgi:ABC-type sugar transport system ATPase subunit